MPYKIGIIGAARRHQGTGPFIARSFSQLGHTISGILGTSSASVNEATTHLSNQYGISTRGYTNIEELFDQQQLDIVVISSPPDSHLEYLETSIKHRCHVFCEKPFWWPNREIADIDQSTYEDKINQILLLADNNHSYIHINTQWPYTLRDFSCLHPIAMNSGHINQFKMNLSPQSQGSTMLIDAASHGLSMLYALTGIGEICNIDIEHELNDVQNQTRIRFDYMHKNGITESELGFLESQTTPKPASYQINGHTVNRIVSLPEYQIQLQSEHQTINIQDPLDASIQDFLACIDAGLNSDNAAILHGARHLFQLIESYK